MTIHQLQSDVAPPERFTFPFNYEPHPLCRLAAAEVQRYIAAHDIIRADADKGKMFGVLVVDCCQQLAFVAAYSGLLAGRNDWEYFVPPVFDAQQPDGYFKRREREIAAAADHSEMSARLQQWLFSNYNMLNARGESKNLVDLWQQYYDRPKLRRQYPLPPGGTGDCCAPKLLQYAYSHGLRPLCMAEFWWGATTGSELRRHLNYYPACLSKCKPVLTWMLQGLDVDPDPALSAVSAADMPVVYEDQWLMVVNKPSGLLSVPGRSTAVSAEAIVAQQYPGAQAVHRLDMATSGLLILAKDAGTMRLMQSKFVRHEVRKRYVALLEAGGSQHAGDAGTVSLPLRPDFISHPRQVVDPDHGKRAVTDYQFLTDRLVALHPQTGRTHQLRIHCAHPDGLGRPIVGDALYGMTASGGRLMLHASDLWFVHPVSGDSLHLSAPQDW